MHLETLFDARAKALQDLEKLRDISYGVAYGLAVDEYENRVFILNDGEVIVLDN